MTATELYEIVKDHRDVWEDAIVLCRDGDKRYYWASILQDYSLQCSDAAAEVALLGLGVKWLASGGGTGHSYISGMIIGTNGAADIDVWATSCEDINCPRTDILAAVYAAIAEVKRAQASTANP